MKITHIGTKEEDYCGPTRLALYMLEWEESDFKEVDEVDTYTQEYVEEFVQENFQGSNCYCEHDCCGHWQYDRGNLVGLAPYSDDTWIVSQYSGMNV